MASESRAARTARERSWRYDVVVLNANNQMKLACVKVLREFLPEFGLEQQLEFVQRTMPVAVAGVERSLARRVRDRLLEINVEVSIRSTVSTRTELTNKALVLEFKPVATESLSQHTLGCEVLLRTFKDHIGCNCDCH